MNSDKPKYDLNAPDQRKLKIARTEIESILAKHDLAGCVVLHTPGMSEFFYDVRPSYSCAWIDESVPMLRMKSLAADYGGDKTAQVNDQAATANLFSSVAADLFAAAGMFKDCARVIDKATRAEHSSASRVPDPNEGNLQ